MEIVPLSGLVRSSVEIYWKLLMILNLMLVNYNPITIKYLSYSIANGKLNRKFSLAKGKTTLNIW